MGEGVIIKALSGFYYVAPDSDEAVVTCRARGKLRLGGVSPLVGDRVRFSDDGIGGGTVTEIMERRNSFTRPAVANVDLIVMIASESLPVTDPYLIDRVSAIAVSRDCGVVICINKTDLDPGDQIFEIYRNTGFALVRTSAESGEGIDELRNVLSGRISAFTGNSGVGKSSILNALEPGLGLKTGEVSAKLGRGKHTTRHVELFSIGQGTFIADTPGFASFDFEEGALTRKERLAALFPEFAPYLGKCYFNDCAHIKEPDCAVLAALADGSIHPSRHASYVRLYEAASKINDWEI